MTVTALDPNTALVVVDLQKGLTAIPTAHPIADVVRHAAALADAFRQRTLPVVLVNVDGVAPGRTDQAPRFGELPPDWTDIVPEMNRHPSDHLVTKRTLGAFTNTDLEGYLRGRAVTHVVIVGIATSAGVESTARFAHELGFNVTLVSDAMTDRSGEAHDNSVTRIFPRLAEIGTTRDLLALLATTHPDLAPRP